MVDKDKPICKRCGEKAFRHIEIGGETRIDTIGSVEIHVTDEGTYFHGTR